jgi:hypothetical protein
MVNQRRRAIARFMLVISLSLAVDVAGAQSKKSKYTCDEPNAQSLCNAGNTCGSPSAPCDVDVKRTAYGASATPQIPGAKGNTLFCVRPGTTLNCFEKYRICRRCQ